MSWWDTVTDTFDDASDFLFGSDGIGGSQSGVVGEGWEWLFGADGPGGSQSGAAGNFLQNNSGILSILGGGAAAYFNKDNMPDPTGYQGRIPNYEFNRQQIQRDDTGRRPGSAGRSYFTPGYFSSEENERGQGMPGRDHVYRTPPPTDAIGVNEDGASGGQGIITIPGGTQPGGGSQTQPGFISPPPGENQQIQNFAQGGLAGLTGSSQYLRGQTDGMADKVPSTIDGEQPAALSHGEFVIPADVVSHLGNGNSESGAKILEQMMSRVRQERTGNDKQGKQINPNAMIPR